MSKEAIEKCVALAGGQTALVEKMKPHLPPKLAGAIRQGHLWGWLNRDRMSPVPPPEYVLAMCKAVGHEVREFELRPDIYPAPSNNDQAVA